MNIVNYIYISYVHHACNLDAHNDVGTICLVLQRCSKVETVKLKVTLCPVACLTSMLSSVDLTNSLTNFTLESGCLQMSGWSQILAKFYKMKTKLIAQPAYKESDQRNLLSLPTQFIARNTVLTFRFCRKISRSKHFHMPIIFVFFHRCYIIVLSRSNQLSNEYISDTKVMFMIHFV